jgi:hypothetical protein
MIIGPKRQEVGGRNCIMRSLMVCLLTNIIRVIKSIRMRCARHVECMEDRGDEYRVLVGKPEGKYLGVEGRIILKHIFKKEGGVD